MCHSIHTHLYDHELSCINCMLYVLYIVKYVCKALQYSLCVCVCLWVGCLWQCGVVLCSGSHVQPIPFCLTRLQDVPIWSDWTEDDQVVIIT